MAAGPKTRIVFAPPAHQAAGGDRDGPSLARRRCAGPWHRSADKLRAIVAELVPPAVEQPGIVAPTSPASSRAGDGRQAQVVLTVAGPYAIGSEAVVQACIANGTHHLDHQRTFWGNEITARHHRRGRRG
jgi:short subunit dehydrogenase-like uncharacterized protein